jgi:hypothetical protein
MSSEACAPASKHRLEHANASHAPAVSRRRPPGCARGPRAQGNRRGTRRRTCTQTTQKKRSRRTDGEAGPQGKVGEGRGGGETSRTVRVGHEAGEQAGGGAAVAEQAVRRGRERLLLLLLMMMMLMMMLKRRRRHADLAGAAVRPLERPAAAAVRAAGGLAGGEAGGLGGVEPADGRRRRVGVAAGDGLRDGGEERARRGAVPRQLPRPGRRRHRAVVVVRRRQAVHGGCAAAAGDRWGGARCDLVVVVVVVEWEARWCGGAVAAAFEPASEMPRGRGDGCWAGARTDAPAAGPTQRKDARKEGKEGSQGTACICIV